MDEILKLHHNTEENDTNIMDQSPMKLDNLTEDDSNGKACVDIAMNVIESILPSSKEVTDDLLDTGSISVVDNIPLSQNTRLVSMVSMVSTNVPITGILSEDDLLIKPKPNVLEENLTVSPVLELSSNLILAISDLDEKEAFVVESEKEAQDNDVKMVDIAFEISTENVVENYSLTKNDEETTLESEAVHTEPMEDCTESNQWIIDYDFQNEKCVVSEGEIFSKIDNNYLKLCKWAPDGSCLLTSSNDSKLRLFNLPNSLWTSNITNVTTLPLALTMTEGGLVYDSCFYPLMNSQNPDSCVVAATSRGQPVHLYCAFTGELRCSYRSYDQMDELTSAKCVSFNTSGDKLYCGFERVIRIFDTARPGRDFQEVSYKSTKKRQVRGQAGIMSSLGFHPDGTMFAVGSYAKTVGLYDATNNKCAVILRGHSSGVTQVRFSPNGNHLFAGMRMDNDIFCWDIRHSRAPAFRLKRFVKTNQRMQFSIDPTGRFLSSGNLDGKISVWDLQGNVSEDSDVLTPVREFTAHNDCVNSVDFHPYLPLISSAAGQHHNIGFEANLESDGNDEDEDDEESSDFNENIDNSIKLWWFGKAGTEMSATE